MCFELFVGLGSRYQYGTTAWSGWLRFGAAAGRKRVAGPEGFWAGFEVGVAPAKRREQLQLEMVL